MATADSFDTGYRRELLHLIHERGLDGVVRLLPHTTDLSVAYSLADVVVAPSIKAEGFGRVPVEAQAMGRPVIATASPHHHHYASSSCSDCGTGSSHSYVHVHGYYNKHGHYVHPYWRTRSDGTERNNFSAKGNYNPFTHKYGHKRVTH